MGSGRDDKVRIDMLATGDESFDVVATNPQGEEVKNEKFSKWRKTFVEIYGREDASR
jgi:hypothetical protein